MCGYDALDTCNSIDAHVYMNCQSHCQYFNLTDIVNDFKPLRCKTQSIGASPILSLSLLRTEY